MAIYTNGSQCYGSIPIMVLQDCDNVVGLLILPRTLWSSKHFNIKVTGSKTCKNVRICGTERRKTVRIEDLIRLRSSLKTVIGCHRFKKLLHHLFAVICGFR